MGFLHIFGARVAFQPLKLNFNAKKYALIVQSIAEVLMTRSSQTWS